MSQLIKTPPGVRKNYQSTRTITLIFGYIFLSIQILGFIGFLMGHLHQWITVVICGIMAFGLFYEASLYKKKKINVH